MKLSEIISQIGDLDVLKLEHMPIKNAEGKAHFWLSQPLLRHELLSRDPDQQYTLLIIKEKK